MNQQCVSDPSMANHGCCNKCVSWTAVIVGALVALGISFLLNLFGMSIGLTAFATNAADDVKTLAIGGFIGLAIIAIVSMGIGGMVAGCIGRARCSSHRLGALHGFTAWCFALILMICLSSHMGAFVAMNVGDLSDTNVTLVSNQNDRVTLSNPHAKMNTTVSAEKAAGGLATGTFVTFVLFALGALAASIGGHMSACKCCEDKTCCPTETNPRMKTRI